MTDMPTSITDVLAGLRGVLLQTETGIARLREAAAVWDDASILYAQAMAGSWQPEAAEQAGIAAAVQRQLREVAELVGQCALKIESAIRHYEGEPTGPAATPTPTPVPTSTDAERGLQRRIEQAQRRVGRAEIGSSPAQGEWVRSDKRDIPMQSGMGRDMYSARARHFIRQFPPEQTQIGRLATHIEVKVACWMRYKELTEETVVIDRSVCGTRDFDKHYKQTCDKQLETMFLAPGSILHVIFPDGNITYIGKEKGE
jgi:hypothetical protein